MLNKYQKRPRNYWLALPNYVNLSEKDLLEFVGVYKVKGGYEFKVDRNTGTKLLAIASMVDRNMSLQAINENLSETGDITGKVKAGSKSAKRRKSYCARSAGQMKKFPKAAKNPKSRLRQARKRWKC